MMTVTTRRFSTKSKITDKHGNSVEFLHTSEIEVKPIPPPPPPPVALTPPPPYKPARSDEDIVSQVSFIGL